MYRLNKTKTALIDYSNRHPETDDDLIPTRPPLELRGLFFDIALRGEEPAFEFGQFGENGKELTFFARDASGTIVSLDLEEFFPGEDSLSDPDHQKLVKYGDIAADESFFCDGQDYVDSTGAWTLHGFSFECPPVHSEYDCNMFLLQNLRIWPAGGAWDGVTRVGDALASGELPSDVFTRCEPSLRVELRMRGIDYCLRSIPERSELTTLAREFYEKRFGL